MTARPGLANQPSPERPEQQTLWLLLRPMHCLLWRGMRGDQFSQPKFSFRQARIAVVSVF